MDEAGIIGCSESSYFVQSFANSGSQERRSIGSLQNIFSVNDPTVPTCFTNISTVTIERGRKSVENVLCVGRIPAQRAEHRRDDVAARHQPTFDDQFRQSAVEFDLFSSVFDCSRSRIDSDLQVRRTVS